MWAFCIYDMKKNILSRDRCGEKPLYFRKNLNNFYFGSEINYIHFLSKNLKKNLIIKKYLIFYFMDTNP